MMAVGPDTKLGPVIGDAAKKLKSTRGIETVADLLAFRPRRHTGWDPDFSRLVKHSYAVVVAQVERANTRPMKARRGTMFTAVITDRRRNEMSLTWFKPYHANKLVPGVWGIFAGEVSEFNGDLQLTHPDFELIADPAQQPRWDGNDNLAEAPEGQRMHAVGDVFTMELTKPGASRENHVVEFVEGRSVAWKPAPIGEAPPGHLWRWELEPDDDGRTRVTHTYDWTDLHDESRLPRVRATTTDRLLASVDRLAALAESLDAGPR